MKITKLSNPEAASGFNVRIAVDYKDLTATGNTQTLDLLALKLGQAILRTALRVVTPFDSSDGTLISYAATLGDAGSANRYISSKELAADGSTDLAAVSATAYVYVAAGVLKLAFTGTSGKALNTTTQGEVHIYAQVADLTTI